jgi:2-keto-4-pentenoate hydratase
MIAEDERREVAAVLLAARRDRAAIPPLTETWPGIDMADAYAVQSLVVDERRRGGAALTGWKVGLTSEAMQRQLGVDQPDFGPLLDDMNVPTGGSVDTGELIAPRAEGELAFRLARDLSGPGVELEHVVEAVDLVLPAIEIIDSRIADWKIKLQDTIADHASCALYAIGAPGAPASGLDVGSIALSLVEDGTEVESGVGAAVLGHPLRAVAWLANALADYGESLKAGQIVMAGALHAAIPVRPGALVEARFTDGVGSVSVRFG